MPASWNRKSRGLARNVEGLSLEKIWCYLMTVNQTLLNLNKYICIANIPLRWTIRHKPMLPLDPRWCTPLGSALRERPPSHWWSEGSYTLSHCIVVTSCRNSYTAGAQPGHQGALDRAAKDTVEHCDWRALPAGRHKCTRCQCPVLLARPMFSVVMTIEPVGLRELRKRHWSKRVQ